MLFVMAVITGCMLLLLPPHNKHFAKTLKLEQTVAGFSETYKAETLKVHAKENGRSGMAPRSSWALSEVTPEDNKPSASGSNTC
jgi:hypothetical protein